MRSGASDEEIANFVAGLLAVRADPGRQASYDRAWVLKAVASFRHRDRDTDIAILDLRGQLLRK